MYSITVTTKHGVTCVDVGKVITSGNKSFSRGPVQELDCVSKSDLN